MRNSHTRNRMFSTALAVIGGFLGMVLPSPAAVIYVAADGAGDGSSWESPMGWTEAIDAYSTSAGSNELWVKGDVPITSTAMTTKRTVNGTLVIRGGFAGIEATAADREMGIFTLVSQSASYNLLSFGVAQGAALTIERFAFTGAASQALTKTGAGDLTVIDCDFYSNGNNKAAGRGINCSGGTLTVTNCKFRNNRRSTLGSALGNGGAVSVSSCAKAVLDNCRFEANSAPLSEFKAEYGGRFFGSAFYASATPVVMRNCRFTGNGAQQEYAADAGTVFLDGACGGSAFTNCVWMGNHEEQGNNGDATTGGGTVQFRLKNATDAVDMCGCTIAYNITQSGNCAAGLNIIKGTVHITDSVIWRNLRCYLESASIGNDITVKADGRLSIEQSTLTSTEPWAVSSVAGAVVDIDAATISTENPRMATSVVDFENLLVDKNNGRTGHSYHFNKNASTYEALNAFDPTRHPVTPADVGAGNVLYVFAAAAPGGDGSSWEKAFNNLESAFAAVSSVKNEIWIAGDLTADAAPVPAIVDYDVIVRGGFAGSETSAADRAEAARTKIDGAGAYDLLRLSVNAGRKATFERIAFWNGLNRAVCKMGPGDLEFTRCLFQNSGRTVNVIGRAVYALLGESAANLVFDGCEVGGQLYQKSAAGNVDGGAVFAGAQGRLIVDNSLFVSNGVLKANKGTGGGDGKGNVICAMRTPVLFRSSRFSGNSGSCWGNTSDGGLIAVHGAMDGSAFTNCAFSGNYAYRYGTKVTDYDGTLILDGAATDKVDIEGCTFAYNVLQSEGSASGLTVVNGDVTIHNSIFWKNLHGTVSSATSGYGADIEVKGGVTRVSHSIVTGTEIAYCHGVNSGNLVLDPETVYTVDPLFVTPYDDFIANYSVSASVINPANGFSYAALAATDVHLLSPERYFLNSGAVGPTTSSYSQAIDKGDPTSDCTNEPNPNGNRINLGAYGNTTEASSTSLGQPAVGSLTTECVDGVSRPRVTLIAGISSGSDYSATVTLICRVGDDAYSVSYENVHNGNVKVWDVPKYLQDGTAYTVECRIECDGATTVGGSTDGVSHGTCPSFVGKGGGEGVIHVRGGADCLKDGSDWEHAYPDLASALAAITADTEEVWIATNVAYASFTLEPTASIVFRGGFAGVETAKEGRPAGVKTDFDYAGNLGQITLANGAGAAVTFDRFVFRRSQDRAIRKTGAGDLTFTDCGFFKNGDGVKIAGRALYIDAGGGEAVIRLERCTVAEHLVPTGESTTVFQGHAVRIDNCARLFVDETLFTSNGIDTTSSAAAGNKPGAAIYANATPVTARKSRFVANRMGLRYANDGGTVVLVGNCGGSAFTNCVFVGNCEFLYSSQSPQTCGALVSRLSSTAQTLDVESCTFAYNMSQGDRTAAALTVAGGTVRVHNSIFWKNIRGYLSLTGYGSEIQVHGGVCNVSHSLLTGTDLAYCNTSGSGVLNLDTDNGTVYSFDPLFVSPFSAFDSMFTAGTMYGVNGTFSWAKVAELDVHLLSPQQYFVNGGAVGPATTSYSQAIDKGDPASAFALEPTPNGGQINLGAYGNTTEASSTSVGQPSVASFTVEYPNGWSRPEAHLVMGINSGSDYNALVTLTLLNGETVIAEKSWENVHNLQEIVWLAPRFFDAGTDLNYRWVITADGATDVRSGAETTTADGFPDYYGKSGGADVIHVRSGADCTADGNDWTYAYPDLKSAFAAAMANPAKREIWIAQGTYGYDELLMVTNSIALRGGFRGGETAAEQRPDGGLATFDNASLLNGVTASNATGTVIALERIRFTGASSQAVIKKGPGSVSVTDCRFEANGRNSNSSGKGLYVDGGNAATMKVGVTNCVFAGNMQVGNHANSASYGAAIYLSGCPRADVLGCLFVTNGIAYASPGAANYQHKVGSAIYVTGTRLYCRNSRFAANGACVCGDAVSGGTVVLSGSCGGSAFVNCAFVGNYEAVASVAGGCSGALGLNLGSAAQTVGVTNCTFAYNLSVYRQSAGAVNVIRGTLEVVDSIFWGNANGHIDTEEEIVYGDLGAAHDIEVKANGRVVGRNVLIASTAFPYVRTLEGGSCEIISVVTDDALFVTPTDDITALYASGSTDYWYPSSAMGALAAIDVHLRGGKGYVDEATKRLVRDYARGYMPDSPVIFLGNRNWGAYGRTPYATISRIGSMLIVR